jgi:uncharacterized RDD family membrane protein YckC
LPRKAIMDCPNCNKLTPSHKAFCVHCQTFVANPQAGKKVGLPKRLTANALDYLPTLLILLLWTTEVARRPTFDYSPLVATGAGLTMLLYLSFLFWLWSDGISPAKRLLDRGVVDRQDGNYVGFWAMIQRETVGKLLSGLCLGLGFLWALWDQDSQTWHDKIAGTVVVQRHRQPSSFGDLQTSASCSTEQEKPNLVVYYCPDCKQVLGQGIRVCPQCRRQVQFVPANAMPVEQLLKQGIAQIQSGDIVAGRAALRHVVKQSPDNATAWLWMGWIAVGQRDQRIAEICFLQAQRLGHPKAAQILDTLGQIQSEHLTLDALGMEPLG